MRIHVLGVGAIGTLLSYNLRRQLRPNPLYPISLLLQRKGLPRVNASRLTPTKDGAPAEKDGETVGVESGAEKPFTGKVILDCQNGFRTDSVSGFDVEITSTRGSNMNQERKEIDPSRRVETPITVSLWSQEPIQSLIVTLKCPATVFAISQLRHRIRPDSVITLLQNGMGVYDQLCDRIWPDVSERPQFILASTTHGAQLSHPSAAKSSLDLSVPLGETPYLRRKVLHNGKGDIKLGVVPDPRGLVDYNAILFPGYPGDSTAANPSPSPSLPLPSLTPSSVSSTTKSPLEETLSVLLSLRSLSPTLLPMPQMYHSLLLKVAINAAINPITAILDLKNGELLGNRSVEKLVNAVCDENSKIITTYLYSLSGIAPTDIRSYQNPLAARKGGPPPDLLAKFSSESLRKQVMTVLYKTSPNVSSMLSDVRRGVGKTEIDYITGYLVGLGDRMGVDTVVNRMLYSMVEAKTEFLVKGPVLGKASRAKL